MILGVPVSELLLLAALIVVGGFITGILAGLFGIGGGALIVPVLYEVFRVLDVPDEVRFQLCVGTSIAIIVPTNVLSYFTHRDKGAVRWMWCEHGRCRRWSALPPARPLRLLPPAAGSSPPSC